MPLGNPQGYLQSQARQHVPQPAARSPRAIQPAALLARARVAQRGAGPQTAAAVPQAAAVVTPQKLPSERLADLRLLRYALRRQQQRPVG